MSSYRMVNSVVSKRKISALQFCSEKPMAWSAQFGYTETYAVLSEGKTDSCIGSVSQFRYDGQTEFYAAYG